MTTAVLWIAVVTTAVSVAIGILRPDLLETSEHVRHRGDIIEKDWYKGVASPIRFDRTKASLRRVPPKFSQDTRAVLEEYGYSKQQIDDLIAQAVVCGPERRR